MTENKDDLTYVPIVGPGVDAINRRDPTIMEKVREQARNIFRSVKAEKQKP